jgi:hypothetical protein
VPNISVLPEPEAAAVVAVDELELELELEFELRLLLHPTATKPAASTTNKPDRQVMRPMDIPPVC